MQVNRSDIMRGVATGLTLVAGGTVVIIPFLFWGSSHAPEFFGAFTAASVAAVAVVLGAYYQATLTRQRDDEIRRTEQLSQAIDIYYWLDHAAFELEFIADTLQEVRRSLDRSAKPALDVPLDRYREIVSSAFIGEIRSRAREASQLPQPAAGFVSKALYRCYTAVNRTHKLHAVPESFRPTPSYIETHEYVTRAEADRLRIAQVRLGEIIGVPAAECA